MKSKSIITLLIFIFSSSLGKAKELPIAIDSIIIYHLLLSMKTSLSLEDYDVRNFDSEIANRPLLKIDIEKDSLKLNEFIVSDFLDDSYKSEFNFSIDVRIVADIYTEKGLELTIVLDSIGYYIVGDEKFRRSRNGKLITWLQNYIPELK